MNTKTNDMDLAKGPITMIGPFESKEDRDSWEAYQDDTLTMIGHDDNLDRKRCEYCLGCMDCLGLSWRDFL